MSLKNNSNKEKTRNLSFFQYFEQLQLEYIIAELRKKIYPSAKDKIFYEKVMVGKKRTIEDISIRNSLKDIFNDRNTKIEKYKKIYNKTGFPNFIYKDKDNKEKFEEKDKRFYYMKDCEFKISLPNEEEKIGRLKNISFLTESAEIEFEGEEDISIFDLQFLTRIL